MWNQVYPSLKNLNTARRKISQMIGLIFYPGYFQVHGFPYNKDWNVIGRPFLRAVPSAHIEIGSRLVLISNLTANPIGIIQPVFLRVEANAELKIGDDVGISGSTISVAKKITIGSETLIGSGVLIIDSDLHQLDPDGRRYSQHGIKSAPIDIGKKVFIGSRCIILKGVKIGDGSVIGAGSVVTSDIPAMTLAAGNPARIIRKL